MGTLNRLLQKNSIRSWWLGPSNCSW